ncbi:MAG: AMP-binding protein, partial [Lysobacterales bacterium]
SHPQRPHVYLYGEGDEPETITYATLVDGARAVAAGLQARGLLPGQSVAIMLPTGRDYLFSFFGILLAGGIPVPIYPPLRPSQLEDHLRRHAGILGNAQTVLLITVAEAQRLGRLLQGQVDTLGEVITPQQLAVSAAAFSDRPIRTQDIAFLQYTSVSIVIGGTLRLGVHSIVWCWRSVMVRNAKCTPAFAKPKGSPRPAEFEYEPYVSEMPHTHELPGNGPDTSDLLPPFLPLCWYGRPHFRLALSMQAVKVPPQTWRHRTIYTVAAALIPLILPGLYFLPQRDSQ